MKLDLEPHEVTIILEALAARPYNEVAALIHKIVHQDAQQKIKPRGVKTHGNPILSELQRN